MYLKLIYVIHINIYKYVGIHYHVYFCFYQINCFTPSNSNVIPFSKSLLGSYRIQHLIFLFRLCETRSPEKDLRRRHCCEQCHCQCSHRMGSSRRYIQFFIKTQWLSIIKTNGNWRTKQTVRIVCCTDAAVTTRPLFPVRLTHYKGKKQR